MEEPHLGHALDVADEWLLVLEGGRVIYSNRGLQESINRSPDDAVGRRLEDVIPRDLSDGMSDLMQEMSTNEGHMVTGKLGTADAVMGVSAFAVRGERRGGYTYLSINRPVMDGAGSEDRLMELEDRLSALLSLTASAGMGVEVFEIDQEDRYIPRSFNEHIIRIFNRPEEELLSNEPLEWIHPDDKETARRSIKELVETGSTSSPTQLRIIDGEGEVVHVQVAHTMLSHPNERIGIGFVQDTTPMHEALEMQNRMVQAIERVQDTVVLADPNGKVFYANPAALRNSGYTLEEVMGEPITIFNSPEASQTFVEEAMQELLQRGWWRGEVMAITKDGRQYPVEVVASLVRDGHGDLSMIVVISRKIEERRRYEAGMLLAKTNNERMREMLADRLFPRLEATVEALEGLASSEAEPADLEGVLRDLRGVIEESSALIEALPSAEGAEALEPTLLTKMVSDRLQNLIEHRREEGTDLEASLASSDPTILVMANGMFPDLLVRLLDMLLSMSEMDRPDFTISVDTIDATELPDTPDGRMGGAGDRVYATLTITAPGLEVGEELGRILARHTAASRSMLLDDQSLAVETSRMLLFLYRGRIVVEEGDGGDHVMVLLPLADPDGP